jgi:hypothetical protein
MAPDADGSLTRSPNAPTRHDGAGALGRLVTRRKTCLAAVRVTTVSQSKENTMRKLILAGCVLAALGCSTTTKEVVEPPPAAQPVVVAPAPAQPAPVVVTPEPPPAKVIVVPSN